VGRERFPIGPRGFWIAFVIVALLIIIRPHVGTVWRVVVPPPSKPTSAPPPGFVADTAPPQRFLDKRECNLALMEFSNAEVTGAYCAPKNALLWGW
jgi:hypothetical protein